MAYTEAPLHPLAQTVAVLNMDMIGRDEEVPEDGGARFRGLSPQAAETNRNSVNLLGYSRSPDLPRVVEHANGLTGLQLRFRYDDNASDLLRRSDQWPFLYLGVPAMFVHTGLHPDYHTERDRPRPPQLREDGAHRAVGAPGELESGAGRDAAGVCPSLTVSLSDDSASSNTQSSRMQSSSASRYRARGISIAPNCCRCGVTHWTSSSPNPRSRSRATRKHRATFDASRTR